MMGKMGAFVALAALLAAPVGVRAQVDTRQPSVFNDYLNVKAPSSFLSIPGLSFQSSMGFSYVSAGGAGSFGMGYYMGHFGYRLGSSLTLHADVGVGSIMTDENGYRRPELFLPNLDLTYHPSNSFIFRLQFQQYRYPGYFLPR
jgi:hypothetical protein